MVLNLSQRTALANCQTFESAFECVWSAWNFVAIDPKGVRPTACRPSETYAVLSDVCNVKELPGLIFETHADYVAAK